MYRTWILGFFHPQYIACYHRYGLYARHCRYRQPRNVQQSYITHPHDDGAGYTA